MDLCSIASGSSGNCIYVGNEQTGILVDAGISKKRITDGLKKININPATLKGIVVTHEHSDHIKGLGVMSRQYEIPIYATRETITGILQSSTVGAIKRELFHPISPN